MINKKNVLETADALENYRFDELGFNATWPFWSPEISPSNTIMPDKSGRGRTTVVDIQGWILSTKWKRAFTIQDMIMGYLDMGKLRREVCSFLGIDPIQYLQLVQYRNHPNNDRNKGLGWDWPNDLTPEQHVRLLRNLAKTGEVDWNA